jgi:hypothetical protein
MSSPSTAAASETLRDTHIVDFDQGNLLDLDFTAWELARKHPVHPDVEVDELISLSKNWYVK